MANVPTSEEVPQVGLRNTRDITQVPGNPALAAGVEAASSAQRAFEVIADHQNEIAMNAADIAVAGDLDKIRQKYAADDDWQTAPDRARAEALTAVKANGQGLRGASTQRAWLERQAERMGNFDIQMRAQSRERGVHMARADLIGLGDQAQKAAGDLTNSEEVRQTAVENFGGALQRAEDSGMLDPDDGAEMESRFAQGVKQRVQRGLVAEFTRRQDLDPDALAHELEAGEGQWAQLDPDDRADMALRAHRAGAAVAVNDALALTLRTGTVVGEDNPALAGRWRYMDEGAKLAYAERASTAFRTHEAAAALGSLAGLSLAEIATRADSADGQGGGGPLILAARAHLRAARDDPAAYTVATQPNVSALKQAYTQLYQANHATGAHPTTQALGDEQQALVAYSAELLRAQAAIGVSQGQQRLFSNQMVMDWGRHIRTLPLADQEAALARLPDEMFNRYGDQDLADRAVLEWTEGYYAVEPSPANAPAPHPADAAAQGADYESVRPRVLQLLAVPGTAANVGALMNTLSPADRQRLFQSLTPEQRAAAVGGP